MFSLYSCVDSSSPWMVFELKKECIEYSSLLGGKFVLRNKTKTRKQLIEHYGHLSFDMLYLYGKI